MDTNQHLTGKIEKQRGERDTDLFVILGIIGEYCARYSNQYCDCTRLLLQFNIITSDAFIWHFSDHR